MQPQDQSPFPQQPNTGTPPVGNPNPAPTPSPTPTGGGAPNAWQTPGATPPAKNNKKMMMIIVGVVVGLAVIAALAFGATKLFGSSIKLETFSNDDFSVLVPVGYTKEENQMLEFKEPGDDNTQSAVIAYYEKLPQTLEESQLAEVRDVFREQLEGSADQFVTGNEEIENLKVEDVTFKGEEGIQLTATMTENGKKVGDIKLVAVINTEAIYLVGVGVHTSDADLGKKIDTIINSFELKQ